MVSRILYATDLGLYGPYIMNQVALLAQATGARVDVVHVVEPLGVFAESILNAYLPAEKIGELKGVELERVLDTIRSQVVDTLNSDYRTELELINLGEVIVEVGKPAEVILSEAKSRASDLIVVGSHGQHAYKAGLIGSVVTKILQLSTVPVYMIPMVKLEDLGRS